MLNNQVLPAISCYLPPPMDGSLLTSSSRVTAFKPVIKEVNESFKHGYPSPPLQFSNDRELYYPRIL